jgi:hypothetical protein
MKNLSCGPSLPSWYRQMVSYFFFLATFFLAFFLAATQLTSDRMLVHLPSVKTEKILHG